MDKTSIRMGEELTVRDKIQIFPQLRPSASNSDIFLLTRDGGWVQQLLTWCLAEAPSGEDQQLIPEDSPLRIRACPFLGEGEGIGGKIE